MLNKIKKIEIEIPDEKYKELEYLCGKINQEVLEKIQSLIIDAINSSEVINF
ncbi:hypothetical protein ES704_01460 [subsurface metagenome]